MKWQKSLCSVDGVVGKHIVYLLKIIISPRWSPPADEVQQGKYRCLFPPDNLLKGKEDAGSCYARCYYRQQSEGLLTAQVVMERLSRMVDACDDLQGFLVFHSLGGGTGAGLTAALMEQLTVEYPKKIKINFALYPSTRFSQSAVQPYNCVLATHATMPDIDCTFLFDNDAVFDLCTVQGKLNDPRLNDLNALIAQVTSTVTLGLRTTESEFSTLQKIPVNLVPFPRLHFPLVSYAPVVGVGQCHDLCPSATTLAHSCFDPKTHLVKCDPSRGKYAACCLLYRGNVALADVTKAIDSIKAKRRLEFVDWCSAGLKISLNSIGPHALPGNHFEAPCSALCTLTCNSAIADLWSDLIHTFDRMFSKKAFLHWYTREGMDASQFLEARDDLAALEAEYREQFASTYSSGGNNRHQESYTDL